MRAEHAVSAFYADREATEAAIAALHAAGVPRDRIDVAVSSAAADRFFGGRARARRGQPLRFAGAGALVGLVCGAAISLATIALPGQVEPRLAVIAQLLGPNLATMTGAALGALVGLAIRRQPSPLHARAVLASDAILLVVRLEEAASAEAAAALLSASGGRDVARLPA